MFKKSFFIMIAAAMVAVPVLAADQDFELHNNSSHVMTSLYVSPHSEDHWGPDILGQDTLAEGASVSVKFDREESECQWDIKGDFEGGGSAEIDDVNFCQVSEVNFHD